MRHKTDSQGKRVGQALSDTTISRKRAADKETGMRGKPTCALHVVHGAETDSSDQCPKEEG